MSTALLIIGILVNLVGAVGLLVNALKRIRTRRDVSMPGYRREEIENAMRRRRYIWLGLILVGPLIVYLGAIIP